MKLLNNRRIVEMFLHIMFNHGCIIGLILTPQDFFYLVITDFFIPQVRVKHLVGSKAHISM